MSITNSFARLAADALIDFSKAPILYFSSGENARGEAIRFAKLGEDTVERVEGSETLSIRSAAGRTVALFAVGADGLPTVDAGGGPTHPRRRREAAQGRAMPRQRTVRSR